MLAAIGVERRRGPLRRDPRRRCASTARSTCRAGMPEQDVYAHLRDSPRATSRTEDELSFLGARDVRPLRPGARRHAHVALGVPHAVHALPARGLPGRAAGDVRVPDGDLRADRRCRSPTRRSTRARAPSRAAGYLAQLANGARRFVVSRGVHPHARETLRTYAHGFGAEIDRGAAARRPSPTRTRGRRRSTTTRARSFFAAAELPRRRRGRRGAGRRGARTAGAVVVGSYDPIALGHPAPPGECGVDVRVGEGQPLGNRLDFGGPSFGFFAATEEYLRRMPGRIAGETVDVDGQRGFVLDAADARAAHPPREGDVEHLHRAGAQRAGGRRLPELARPAGARRARRAAAAAHRTTRARRCARSTASSRCTTQPVVREFAVRLRAPTSTRSSSAAPRGASTRATRSAATTPSTRTAARRDHRAAHAGRHRPPRRGLGRVPIAAERGRRRDRRARRRHEARVTPHREHAAAARRASRSSRRAPPGRRAFVAPALDVPEATRDALLPAALRRARARRGCPRSPSRRSSATTSSLSKRNFDLDSGFYPLGSCTMKHNPRLHERVAALPGHARLHPLQDPSRAQGALELMWNLRARARRDRRAAARLAAAVRRLARRARRRAADARLPRGPRRDRTKVLTPDTAHGTNPATVTMAGLRGREGRHERRRRRRPRRPAREGRRRRRLPDAHEPEHARDLRREHRRDRRDRARRRRDALLRRREPQRDHGHHAPGRHGLRHRALQPAQVVHAAARRRRPRLRADRGLRPHRALPAATRGSCARDDGALRPRRRLAGLDRPAARLPGQLRLLRALLRVHPLARRRGPARRVARPPSSTRTTCSPRLGDRRADCLPLAYGGAACTSSSSPARR